MINIIVGIIALLLFILILWCIGAFVFKLQGEERGNIGDTMLYGVLWLVVVLIGSGVVIVALQICNIFGSLIIHAVW